MTCPSMPGVAAVAILDCSVQRPVEGPAASSSYRRSTESTERGKHMATDKMAEKVGCGRREEGIYRVGESLTFAPKWYQHVYLNV